MPVPSVSSSGSLSIGLADSTAEASSWVRPDYDAPTIEMPTYLKLLELGTIGAGVLRRLWQQTR